MSNICVVRIESKSIILVKRLLISLWVIALSSSCSAPSKVALPTSSARINGEISGGILGSWEQLGIQKGQPVPNFTLFSEKGKQFTLASELRKKKPVVLISGSYTCDVSRGNMRAIKSFQKKFSRHANFFMVYTIDAHPSDSPSPYSPEGKVWIPKNNIRDHIKASQPKTYQQRVDLARRWTDENDIEVPVLVDGPDNFYWKKFGQAPNMVYIISPEQDVVYKQAWFNEEKLAEQLELLREAE